MLWAHRDLHRRAWYGGLALALVAGLLGPSLPAVWPDAGSGPSRALAQAPDALATLETVRPAVEWLAIDRDA